MTSVTLAEAGKTYLQDGHNEEVVGFGKAKLPALCKHNLEPKIGDLSKKGPKR